MRKTVPERTRTLVGIETEAFGANPAEMDKTYQFQYRVLNLDDVIASARSAMPPMPPGGGMGGMPPGMGGMGGMGGLPPGMM